MTFSKGESIQYNRHIILDEIGLVGQQKLKEAKVLVIGAGGLGCPVLQYLCAAGVGTIGIIDFDIVDQSNLQRQVLYTIDDVGKNKAESAIQRLSKLNPFVLFEPHPYKLNIENAIALFNQYDIIIDGSDNFPTRYLINDASSITSKPVVFGSIFKFEGQVSVFNYEDGPTYRCLFPEPPSPDEVPNCSEIGVLGVLPAIIGAFQANEAIKIICELGSVLKGKLLVYDALNNYQSVISYHKGTNSKIQSLSNDYDAFCGISLVEEISYESYLSNKQGFSLLDVRTTDEHNKFNIGGANIPLSKLDENLNLFQSKKDFVVYCHSGVRSKKAISKLKELGITNRLVSIKGGVSLLR